jgi:Protein of unknown function (DUF2971)
MAYPLTESKALHDAREERLKDSQPYYLYQPDDLTRLKGLAKDKLWISDPSKFNDPLDLRLKIEDQKYRSPFHDGERLRKAMKVLIEDNPDVPLHWFYNERLIESIQRWIREEIKEFMLEGEITERFREFGVACFTPIRNHALMWSHYANSHKGYCIEFRVNEWDLVLANEGMFSSFHVQYISQLPTLCLTEALFTPHQMLGRMLATKSAEWAYEQEWRLVHLEKKATLVDMPAGIEISALIAGLKANDQLLIDVANKAKELGIPAYKMRHSYGYEVSMELM